MLALVPEPGRPMPGRLVALERVEATCVVVREGDGAHERDVVYWFDAAGELIVRLDPGPSG